MKGKFQKKFHRGNGVSMPEFISRCRDVQWRERHAKTRQRATLEGAYSIEKGYTTLCGIKVPDTDTLVITLQLSA